MKTILAFLIAAAAGRAGEPPLPQSVAATLDAWHLAAAAAQEEKYFSFFTVDAVFLGTDATERWTTEQFRKFAHPYFARGKAWTFRAVERQVSLSSDGLVAWFDEALDTPNLGPARGSGVLLRKDGVWKIVQYNLSVPIPNALMDEVKRRIEEESKKPR